MLQKRLNPFAAILALTVIAATGTMFVVNKIFATDFTYTQAGTSGGVTEHELLTP